MIRAGAVAGTGLPGKSGITAVIIRRGMAAIREVSPVRPPSATPEATLYESSNCGSTT